MSDVVAEWGFRISTEVVEAYLHVEGFCRESHDGRHGLDEYRLCRACGRSVSEYLRGVESRVGDRRWSPDRPMWTGRFPPAVIS